MTWKIFRLLVYLAIVFGCVIYTAPPHVPHGPCP